MSNPKFQISVNAVKGKIAEEIAKQDYVDNGFEIQETGIGSDFIAIKKKDDFVYKEYVDVKSGNARLTKKQKETKNQLRKENIPYVVYRVTNQYLEFQMKTNPELHPFCKDSRFSMFQYANLLIIHNPSSYFNYGLNIKKLEEILSQFKFCNVEVHHR